MRQTAIAGGLHSRRMGNMDRGAEEARARIEAEYRRVLKNSVEFEKKIRNRWREKNREKNARIAELEERVAELERRLQDDATPQDVKEDGMDRDSKERKLVALMISDLNITTEGQDGIGQTREGVRKLSDEELDRTLAERLGLSSPPDQEELELALNGVEEPEYLSEGSAGAPDMSHNPGPGENKD